jgi:hypothetical protein
MHGRVADADAADGSCAQFPLIRYDPDVSSEQHRCEPRNPFAYVPLKHSREANFSLGGEVRERYEHTNNPGFGADPEDAHGVWLQRLALHGDLHLNGRWRIFAELHSVLENGRAAGPGATDENELEFQNSFVEARFESVDDTDVLIRAGRQELQLGSARLISVRDGPNVRRTFDGLRMILQRGSWTWNAIAARPRRDQPGAFDDSTSESQGLWGLYATRKLGTSGDLGVDAYYLGYRNNDALFDQGASSERRHTLGARFFGTSGGWEWNVEPMVQLGSVDDAGLSAWTIASTTNYSWSQVPWEPRLTLSANIASGDRDPQDPDLQTFNPLYPRGNYFSEDATLWPQNFYNAHLFIAVRPATFWTLTIENNWFWRTSTRDAVYGGNGSILRSGAGSDARFVATSLSVTSEWVVNRSLSFTAIYAHSFPQVFLEETGPAEEIRFLELTARFRL